MHCFGVGGAGLAFVEYLIEVLTSWSLIFSGHLYDTSGCDDITSFTKDKSVSLCFFMFFIQFGIPIPYVVLRGIGLASVVGIDFSLIMGKAWSGTALYSSSVFLFIPLSVLEATGQITDVLLAHKMG